jgi:hypothetical protein
MEAVQNMYCHTEQGRRICAFLSHWMEAHPEVNNSGVWTVFEDQSGMDIIVWFCGPEGVRTLRLEWELARLYLEASSVSHIEDWLEKLAHQPAIAG